LRGVIWNVLPLVLTIFTIRINCFCFSPTACPDCKRLSVNISFRFHTNEMGRGQSTTTGALQGTAAALIGAFAGGPQGVPQVQCISRLSLVRPDSKSSWATLIDFIEHVFQQLLRELQA
jgi:hypothetical protein